MKKRTYIIEINSDKVCPDECEFLHTVVSGFCDGYFGEGKASVKINQVMAIKDFLRDKEKKGKKKKK